MLKQKREESNSKGGEKHTVIRRVIIPRDITEEGPDLDLEIEKIDVHTVEEIDRALESVHIVPIVVELIPVRTTLKLVASPKLRRSRQLNAYCARR